MYTNIKDKLRRLVECDFILPISKHALVNLHVHANSTDLVVLLGLHNVVSYKPLGNMS